MKDTKQKVLVIAGPTASGKTTLSVKLAKKFSGEVISADSRQVYKTLDIGTGKITKQEMQDVPHYLIDMVEPTEIYNVDDFKRDGEKAITTIISHGNLPIIAGGTFFYVDTLLGKINPPSVPPNPVLRAKLETLSAEELYNELRERDHRRAAEMDPQNKRRLIRALEIVSVIGKVPAIPADEPYDVLTIGIITEKEALRARFKQRAEEWLEQGFMDEIKSLLASDIPRQRLQEIGFEYLLAIELFEEKITTEEFLQKFIEKNWQYAKRQIAWLKRDESILWFKADESENINMAIQDFVKT